MMHSSWLPDSVSVQLYNALHQHPVHSESPSSRLTLLLPERSCKGKFTCFGQVDGQAQDHSTYLVPLGAADIFFPTDFALLERMYDRVARAQIPGLAGEGSPAPINSSPAALFWFGGGKDASCLAVESMERSRQGERVICDMLMRLGSGCVVQVWRPAP